MVVYGVVAATKTPRVQSIEMRPKLGQVFGIHLQTAHCVLYIPLASSGAAHLPELDSRLGDTFQIV